ncbi:MAG: hypothetical protein AAF998_14660 [Bacteroidota bacterium]
MSDHDRIFNRAEGANQMPESERMRSESPPPFQLVASPVVPPAGGGEGENFPWIGMVKSDAWSSGFYSAPDKSSKATDLPKGTKIRATGRSSGWLEVEILSGENKGQCGFISSERVENLEATNGAINAEPYEEKLEIGDKIESAAGPVPLEDGYREALFYAQEGDRIFVVPGDRIAVEPGAQEVEYQSLIHSFQERGATGFTTLYITYPGDEEFAPLEWYSQASIGGMLDIWGALLEEFANLIENMNPPEWAPGKQPEPFYIGNEAHKAIARNYALLHGGQTVFTNSFPIASILEAYRNKGFSPDIANLTEKELSDRPDISNVSLEHLYEIKPWNSPEQGLTQATYYQRIFAKAKVPMQLGPMNDAATKGALEVPGGYVVFYSPMPGVILYKKKNKQGEKEREPRDVTEPRPFPVPVPVTRPDALPDRPFIPPMVNPFPKFEPESHSIWEWEYWEEVTGLTGAALVIYLIISEGSRLFPPRNAIPIP